MRLDRSRNVLGAVLAVLVAAGVGRHTTDTTPPKPTTPIEPPAWTPDTPPSTVPHIAPGAPLGMFTDRKGCTVTTGTIRYSAPGVYEYVVDASKDVCHPGPAQWMPSRTAASIYPNEPALPPAPPVGPTITDMVLPPIDLDGDGVADIPSVSATTAGVPGNGCDILPSGGIQWGGPGDKLIINGLGGGGDGEISASKIAGPSAVNGDSILVASGFKVSENTDAVVQLPCTNFVITRNFTGEKDWPGTDSNFNSAGTGWTMSFDASVAGTLVPVSYGNVNGLRNWEPALRWHETGGSPGGDGFEYMGQPIVVVSPIHDSVMFTNHRWYRSDTGGAPPDFSSAGGERTRDVREFMPIGPRMQRLEAGFWEMTIGTEAVKRPAWILKDPGGGTSVFFRTPVPSETMPWTPTQSAAEAAGTSSASGLTDYPDGALWQQIDRGGNKWTFHYQRSWLNAGSRAKLTSIVLHGVNETDESTKAVVDIEYYEGGDTYGITASGDLVGSGAVRAIKVRRPYDNGGTTRPWFYTDLVYYDYFGTLKWFRNNTNIQSRMPSGTTPASDLGGRDDDLVQVTRYTALNQPTYHSSAEGNLPLPASINWHTAITQYRYIHIGAGEAPESRNRQIKMEFTPAQIEHLARLNLSTIAADTDGVLTAWGSAASGRPAARLEATAMVLMELQDDTVLSSGVGQPTMLVRNFADRFTAYYTDTDEHYQAFMGRVKTEYTMPGEFGHTRLVNYGYDRLDGCPDLVAFDKLQATEVLLGTGTSLAPLSFSFGLTGRVQREWEYIARGDAPVGDDNPWKLKRLTRHRSEDRVFQEAAIANGAGVYHDTGETDVNFLVITTPVTVNTSVQEIANPSIYEDISTTNDAGLPLGRMWIDRSTFDWNVRGTASFPMGSVSITQPTSSTASLVAWQIDRLRPEVVSGYASAPGRTASRYLEPTPNSVAMREAANTPVTSRVAERWAGAASGSAWEVVSRTAYRASQWYSNAVMLDYWRPDLIVSNENFAAPAATGSAPGNPLIEKTLRSYTFASGTGIVTAAVSSTERESTDEFGVSGSTLDTAYSFDHGVISGVVYPDTSTAAYEYDPVNGQVTKVTMSDGSATIVSTSMYDLVGRQLLSNSPNGDAAAYAYTLAAPPSVKLGTLPSTSVNVGDLPLEVTAGAFGTTDIPVLCIVQLPRPVASSEWAGPVRIDWMTAGQQVLRSSLYAATASPFTGTAPVANITGLSLGDELSRKMGEYVPSGWTVAAHSWGFTPSLAAVSGHREEVYSTSTAYDGDGKTLKTVDALGNQSEPVYDGPGRTIMSQSGLLGATPQPITRTIFDGETGTDGQIRNDGVGPSHVTLSLGLPDGSDFISGGETRGHRTWYDGRGRAIATCAVVVTDETSGVISYSPVGPYSVTMYDNLDRSTCTFTVAADAAESAMLTLAHGSVANVLASSAVSTVTRKEYSQRGLVFRESVYASPLLAPTPPSGTNNRWLVKRHLFDDMGREIATAAAGQPVSKTVYDKLGRVTDTSITSEDYTSISGLRSDTSGTRLEYTHNAYIPGTTLVSRVTKSVRSHTDTATPGLTDGHAVTTYADTVYDAAGRPTGTINYGTGNVLGETGVPADVFADLTTPPTAITFPQAATGHVSISGISDTMRAETFYDPRGQPYKTVTWLNNSLTRTTVQLFDSLARSYATIENTSGTPPTVAWSSSLGRWAVSSWSGAADQDRVTSAVFDAAGDQVLRTAHVRSGTGAGEGTSQSTAFVYTWATSGWPSGWAARTKVPLNGRLYETRYPDPATGVPSGSDIDRVLMAYNGLGEETASRDQRGVVHELVRDNAGRQVADKITAFPSGAISSDAPTSVNVATSSGTSSVTLTHAVDDSVKQISTRYDRFGRVSAVYSHSAFTDYPVSISDGPTLDNGLQRETEGTSSGDLDASPPPRNIVNYVLYQYDRTGEAIRIRQRLDNAAWQSGSTQAAPPPHQIRTYYSYAVPSTHFTFTNAPSTDPDGYEVTRRLDALRYPGFAAADNAADPDGLTPPAHFNGVSMDYGASGSIEDKIGRVSDVMLRSDWPSSSYSGSEALLKRELVDYKYVGLGTRVITNIADADAQSDRTVGDDRSRASAGDPWCYAGWDRFGRLRLQSWVMGKYLPSTTLRPWFQERLGHDLGGRRLTRDLERGGGQSTLFSDDHWRAAYDGLSRMTEGLRGKVASGVFSAQPNSKGWTLDELGNFSAVLTGSTPATSETRAHNATNELSSITSGGGVTTKNRYYDHSGNLLVVTTTTGSTTLLVERMVYDGWNRLVTVERPAPSASLIATDPLDRSENRYNGLSWRTVEWRRFAPRTTGSGLPSLGLARWFTYTGAWQVAQEETWVPLVGWSNGRRSMEQQYYGLRGVDDAVYRRADNAVDASTPPDGCFASDLPTLGSTPPPGVGVDGGYYQLSDSQFSVVGHIDAVTRLLTRRYSYDAYGRLESHVLTDIDGDGSGATAADDAALADAITANDPGGDFNGDGVTDSLDQADYDAAKDLITSPGFLQVGPQGWGDLVEPRIGYAGYVRGEWTTTVSYLGNTKSGITGANGGLSWWLARNRFYDPIAGRWVNRDPSGYADGLSMYLYVSGNPWGLVDPTGLDPDVELKAAYGLMNSGHENLAVGAGWYGGYLGSIANSVAHAPQLLRSSNYIEAAKEAIRGEDNNATHGGYTPNAGDYTLAVAGHFTGATGAASGVFGYSPTEDRVLKSTEERVFATLEGANQMMGSGAAAGGGVLSFAEGGFSALNPLARPTRAPTPPPMITKETAEVSVAEPKTTPQVATGTVGELRAQGLKDAHHVIQDAAVRDVPGYKTNDAPGAQLEGPSTARGTPHYDATQVQREAGGGTYGEERRIGYKALRRAGVSETQARDLIGQADDFFGKLGVVKDTILNTPKNRK